jgi:hypothetical protein
MSPKKLGITGFFIAFVVALPLFVWSAINVNFNINKRAQGEPNFCGGTCGSNYNCQANFFCFEGFCRNPICSTDIDCVCDVATSTPTSKASGTKKPTIKPSPTITSAPKGGSEKFVDSILESPRPKITTPASFVPYTSPTPENQFFTKYAIYLFGTFVLITILSIFYAVRKNRRSNIPHIMPPTNI